MRLRAYLVSLTVATVVPVALFAGTVGYFLVQQDRETFRRGAEARTLAMSTAVDAELEGTIATLQAFATAAAFDTGELPVLRERAARILAKRPDWSNIGLALPAGQQIMNLRQPPGAPLPDLARLEPRWQAAVAAHAPFVSDLMVEPVTSEWAYAVRVPVIRDGEPIYVLSAVVRPASIGRLLQAQDVPADWVAVVLDRNGRIVARTASPGTSVGELASRSLREALERAPAGWFRGSTIEGAEVYTPYRRSPRHGWTFAMGVPAHEVDAAWWGGVAALGLGLAGALAIAFALAHFVSRRIAAPIASLAAATGAMARGVPPARESAGQITEVRLLARALDKASRAVREREELVEREKRALQDADRAKDEFLAMLSHELRNPLAALTAAAHVLRVSEPGSDAAASARAVIGRQTRHMARLIADLLDVGRLSAGKVALSRERLDLAEVLAGVVQVWRGSGRFDRHRVSLEAGPAWVDADRARLEQIAANLLDNAVKFTPAGRAIRIEVRAEGGEAVLRVRDEGIGLEAEEGGRLFDLFVQGRHAEGGMGIGLALVKRLAELHGGAVSASSEGRGRGAVFTVRLPAAPARGEEARGAGEPQGRAREVLLVEDNDDARQMLEAALASGGHRVRAARDAAGGLALAERSPPEVALIDIGLPDMDGYELARRLRAAPGCERLALVAITGYGRPEDRQRAFEAGFAAHLTKPVTPERLSRTLAGLP